jgi:predicted unusual protein kinase regulating ubiquinone biosynthesis (AarF/ABC1/UbiB family)
VGVYVLSIAFDIVSHFVLMITTTTTGDLHPGNVFVSKDGKKFILLDVGIVAEYSEHDHNVIVRILSAFIRRQGRLAGRLMIDDSNRRLHEASIIDAALEEEKFIDKIEALNKKATGGDYLMENLGTYISYICSVAAQHHVMLNPSFISAALAVKVQEGIAIALDPSISIYDIATPIIFESERRRGIVQAAARVAGFEDYLPSFLRSKEADDDDVEK